MKNILISVTFLLFSITTTWSQNLEVPQTQMSLINKIAADWCPPCGGWAWDFFHELIDDNSEHAILFAAHHSGGLQNSVAINMTSNYGVNSQPRFILNSIDQNVSSSNSAIMRTTIQEKVNQKAASSPLVQSGIDAFYSSDGMLRVRTKTSFFDNANGAYYLGVYLIEKTVSHMQANQPNPAEHKNIIRLECTGNDFGNLLASGSIESGATFSNYSEIPLENYEPSNLEIATIIWKKVDNTYVFENANKDSDIQLMEVTNTFSPESEVVQFAVKPNLIQNYATIDIELEESIANANLEVVDIQGRTIQQIYQGQMNKGAQQFTITRNNQMSAGLYFVYLHTDKDLVVRKIVLE